MVSYCMRSKIMNYNKIKPTSPNKVRGKLVKYQKGDCLSIDCGNGKYFAAFISEKFNKYYDFTLIEYLKERKPIIEDFLNGRFFGRYLKDGEEIYLPAVEKLMLPCLEIDANVNIEKVGPLELVDSLEKASYGYRKGIREIRQHYNEDVSWRIQNSIKYEKNAKKFLVSDGLVEMKAILRVEGASAPPSQNIG